MNWLRRLFHKSRSESDLDRELRFHLEEHVRDSVNAGLSADEARRRAQQEFGGLERVKEEVRDAHFETRVEDFADDFLYALRSLWRDKRFASTAVVALALGIGASTIIFSVAYNVFYHALPYKDFDRLVVFGIHNTTEESRSTDRTYFSHAEFQAFREQNHVFEDMIGYGHAGRLFYDDGKSTRVLPYGAGVSTNTFDFLGVAPLIGRSITREDGRAGSPSVFVMSYRLWQREFGGDPRILGKSFLIRGESRTLVGVMPDTFNAFGAGLWMPVKMSQEGGNVVGRLKPGIGVQAATAELEEIARRLKQAEPRGTFPENFTVKARTVLESQIGDFKAALYALLAAVLLLLLIACSNVANLLLARATVREREFAMRVTLGATRARLIRQLLAESFVLAATASAVGCVFAYFGVQAIIPLIPVGTIPDVAVIRLNAPVLLLTLGITFLSTVVCGFAPVLHILRRDVQPHQSSQQRLWWKLQSRKPSFGPRRGRGRAINCPAHRSRLNDAKFSHSHSR
jgi:putative ABC transport system permease protein